jgi:DNA-directed RNA polymerase specialized sigma24 family protein
MRFFGGLSQEETAETLNVSVATVRRDWISRVAGARTEKERRIAPAMRLVELKCLAN